MVIMSLSDSLPLKGVTLFLFSSECNGKNSPHRNYLLGDSPHRMAVLASVENLAFKMISALNSPLGFSDLLPIKTPLCSYNS